MAGRYDIVEKIGRGGMGVVYRARDRDLDETVALKIIHPSLISVDETIVERFKHETRVARRLAHPNILKVFDLGSVGDVFYLSMEYLEGTDLKTHLQAHGPMAIDEAIDVACQVCAGLAYAHASGVIHRDVKPHNIFLVDPATRFGSTMLDPGEPPSRWVVKILNFGLAMAIGYNLYVAQYFEKPIEQIEEGLLTIVNGNTQHRINVEHAELGGIVYRINQLVASLTGEGDEGSDGG